MANKTNGRLKWNVTAWNIYCVTIHSFTVFNQRHMLKRPWALAKTKRLTLTSFVLLLLSVELPEVYAVVVGLIGHTDGTLTTLGDTSGVLFNWRISLVRTIEIQTLGAGRAKLAICLSPSLCFIIKRNMTKIEAIIWLLEASCISHIVFYFLKCFQLKRLKVWKFFHTISVHSLLVLLCLALRGPAHMVWLESKEPRIDKGGVI